MRRSFVLKQAIETRWTKGPIKQINTSQFAVTNNMDINILDITGETIGILPAEEESEDGIFDFAVEASFKFAVTSHDSKLIKMWLQGNDTKWKVAAQWKCIGKYPPYLQIGNDSRILACATSGNTCFFYDLMNQSLIRKYQIPKGIISAMKFDPMGKLWIGDNLGHISIIDPVNGKITIMKSDESPAKTVTAILFVDPYMVITAEEECAFVYDPEDFSKIGLIAAGSTHDAIVDFNNHNSAIFATENGIKRVSIDVSRPKISTLSHADVIQIFNFNDQMFVFDNNGILMEVVPKKERKDNKFITSIPLNLHAIYDIAVDNSTGRICLASMTTTNYISVLDGSKLLKLVGHTDTPLKLAAMSGKLISGAKDSTAKIWSLETGNCITTLEGHNAAVTCVSFIPKTDKVITASADQNIKIWQPVEEEFNRSALSSIIAHTDDINAIDVSRDGSLVASCSADKTAKIWKIIDDNLNLLFTLSGHKRGIWSIAFSNVDKVCVTAGSDNCIKIWSAEDGSCISSFSEFTCSILSARFISNGLQLSIGEASGAVKVLRAKTGVVDYCNPEAHSNKVWCVLPLEDGKQLLTCGEDGKFSVWQDNTEELKAEENAAKAEIAEAEQELKNAFRSEQYLKALRLAFKLKMPSKLRIVIRKISEKNMESVIDQYFTELEDIDDYVQWIDYCAKWATNSRWADDATTTISSLLRAKPISFFTENKYQLQEKIDSIIPYIERHLNRLERLDVQSYAIDFVLDSYQTTV